MASAASGPSAALPGMFASSTCTQAQFKSHAAKPVGEILDHAVGIGMIHIETIQFTVGGQVNARLALEIENDARGVEQRLLAGQGREPVRDGIRADGGGEDARRVAW